MRWGPSSVPEVIRANRGAEEGGHPPKHTIIREKRHRLHELRKQRREIVNQFLALLEGSPVVAELRIEDIEENPCDTRVG